MGTGASGENSGAFPAITPGTELADRNRLKELIAQLEEVIPAVRAAMAEGGDNGDVTRIHLGHLVRDYTVEAAKAGIWWEDGLRYAEARCPVPLREGGKPPSHRKDRPDYLKPLGITAITGALRVAARHPGSRAAHPAGAAFRAHVAAGKTALVTSVAATAAVGAVAIGTMHNVPDVTTRLPQVMAPVTATPAARANPTWTFQPPKPGWTRSASATASAPAAGSSSSLPASVPLLAPVTGSSSTSPPQTGQDNGPGGGSQGTGNQHGNRQGQDQGQDHRGSRDTGGRGGGGSCSDPWSSPPAGTGTGNPAPDPALTAFVRMYTPRHAVRQVV